MGFPGSAGTSSGSVQSITHSLVARSVVILAECSVTNADYASVTGPILTHLARGPLTDPAAAPSIFVHGRHRVHVLLRDGLVFLAIALDTVKVVLMRQMLEEMADRFVEEYGVGYEMPSILIPLCMNAFSRQMSAIMGRYSEKSAIQPPDDLIEQTKEDLGEVQELLSVNIDKLLARGERLEELDERMEQINQTAMQFEQRASGLRKRMQYRNRSVFVGTVVSLGLIIFILVGFLAESTSNP